MYINLFLFPFVNIGFVFFLVIGSIEYTEGEIGAKMFEKMILGNVQR